MLMRRSAFLLVGAVAAAPAAGQTFEHKLLPTVTPVEARLGFSAAVSGTTAVAGAPQWTSSFGVTSGALFVYEHNGLPTAPWAPVAALVPADPLPGEQLGWTLAIDGGVIVAGAPTRNESALFRAGAAYVFERAAPGAPWTEAIRLNAGNDLFEQMQFGYAVDVDGDTIVVGAAFDTYLGPSSGSAFVFLRDATLGWLRSDFLIPGDGDSGHRFGTDVAVSGDLIVVGAPFHSGNGANAGAAYVFLRSGGFFAEVARLTPSDPAVGDRFGSAVAIDDGVIIVTAPGADRALDQQDVGAAYVFLADASAPQGWRQADRLTASDGDAGDQFGFDAAVDAGRIVIGARDDADAAGFRSGAVYLFNPVSIGSQDWAETAKLTAPDPEEADSFGYAVGVSGDALVSGTPFEDEGGNLAGAMYAFNLARPACTADRNRDGMVDVFDLLDYLDFWFAGDADLTGDDLTDVFDLLAYLDDWFDQSSGACA